MLKKFFLIMGKLFVFFLSEEPATNQIINRFYKVGVSNAFSSEIERARKNIPLTSYIKDANASCENKTNDQELSLSSRACIHVLIDIWCLQFFDLSLGRNDAEQQ